MVISHSVVIVWCVLNYLTLLTGQEKIPGNIIKNSAGLQNVVKKCPNTDIYIAKDGLKMHVECKTAV